MLTMMKTWLNQRYNHDDHCAMCTFDLYSWIIFTNKCVGYIFSQYILFDKILNVNNDIFNQHQEYKTSVIAGNEKFKMFKRKKNVCPTFCFWASNKFIGVLLAKLSLFSSFIFRKQSSAKKKRNREKNWKKGGKKMSHCPSQNDL